MHQKTTPLICPLCESSETPPFHQEKRNYFRCSVCQLIFVSFGQLPTPLFEKSRYDLHENSPDDIHYRTFLGRLFKPLLERIPAYSRGLDFGSGPGPTLSVMLEEAGFRMSLYDIFYSNDTQILKRQYDFVTATEVVEHLHKPKETFQQLWGCLRPGGWLAMMTKLAIDEKSFSNWHYKQDPTHVSFFSKETFEWIASWLGGEVFFISQDVIFLRKGVSGTEHPANC